MLLEKQQSLLLFFVCFCFEYLSGARTRVGSLSPVDVPRGSRGSRKPVHGIIGRDATHTATHTEGTSLAHRNFNSFNHHHFVKPQLASLLSFGKEENDK